MSIRPVLFSLLVLVIHADADLSRGPYLQLAREDGVTVVWRTDRAMVAPELRYGPAGGPLELVCKGDAILRRTTESDAPLSRAPDGTVQYEATIGGLTANTTFHYAIHDGETAVTAGEGLRFTTHPPAGKPKPTRIWVVGDSGTGKVHQQMVHTAMRRYIVESDRALDFYLHVGDMAYGQGTDEQFQNHFFEPYEVTLRNTVCWASMGNHEGKSSEGEIGVGPYYDAYVCPTKGEAGGIASGKEAFYSFNYGDIHVICLDSHDLDRRPGGEMAQWLNRDLAATKARWIIAFWHHPPYTKGTHDSDTEVQLVEMRKYIMPILEEGGVDLVLSGHSHIYERSMLIDGAYATPTTADGVVFDDRDGRPDGDGPYRKSGAVTPHNGTVAVVTGHGGALGRNAKGIMPIMRSIVLDHGSTILDIDGDTLTGTMLDLRGKERDRFAIVKRGVVEQKIVANPWTPGEETLERTGEGVQGAPGTAVAAKKAQVFGEKNPALLVPEGARPLIPPHAGWDYLAGGETPETGMWTRVGFDPAEEGWKRGPAGFGYGDGDDRTELPGMRGKYTAIFIRHEFEIPPGTDLSKLGLIINYDDGFVMHANGRQLMSKKVQPGKNGGPPKIGGHEAQGAEYFSLRAFKDVFRVGKNVIAFEGHNLNLNSSDLTLDPAVVVEAGK